MDYLDRFYTILEAAGHLPDEPREAWCTRLRQAIAEQKAELWPIGRDGAMVGGVMFAADTVHIAVLPEWHGRWVTPNMMRAYRCWAHEVPVKAPIKPDNQQAIQLAERLGFRFSQHQGLYDLYQKEPTP